MHNSDVTIDVLKNKIKVHKNNNEDWKITLVDTGENTFTGGRILRIKNLMGLKKPLKEGMYRINKMLLNEDTGYGELMKIYEKLFLKTTQQFDETEQMYLKNFIDETKVE